MRGDIRSLSTFWALLLLGSLAWAGGKGGANGAAFLKVGAGARAAALGDAFTSVADDAYATVWNPAGLARMERPEIAGTHTQWIQSGRHDVLVGAYPTSVGTFGVSAVTLSFENIEKRTEDTDTPDGTFRSLDAAYGLSYGHTLGNRLDVGAGVTYVRQTLDGVSAGAPTGTLGALWRTPISFLTVGAAVRNIGGSITFVEEGDPLPMTAALGATGRFMKKRLLLTVETRQVQNEDIAYGAGVEVSPPLSKDAVGHLRAGYRSERQNTEDASGITLGLGVGFPHWGFDLSWAPYGVLGDTFRYAFRYQF
jgi:hypothetical protein